MKDKLKLSITIIAIISLVVVCWWFEARLGGLWFPVNVNAHFENNSISFDYPDFWEIEQTNPYGRADGLLVSIGGKGDSNFRLYNLGSQDIDTILKTEKEKFTEKNYQFTENTVTIGGVKAYQLRVLTSSDERLYVYLKKNDKVYKLIFFSPSSNSEVGNNLNTIKEGMETILNSLRVN